METTPVQKLHEVARAALETLLRNKGEIGDEKEARAFGDSMRQFNEQFDSPDFKRYLSRFTCAALRTRSLGRPKDEGFAIVDNVRDFLKYATRLNRAYKLAQLGWPYNPQSLSEDLSLVELDLDIIMMHELAVQEAFSSPIA